MLLSLLPLIFFFDFWYCCCFICCWVVALIVCILFLWFCLVVVVVVVKGWNQEKAYKTSAWRCSLVYAGRNSHISSRINYFYGLFNILCTRDNILGRNRFVFFFFFFFFFNGQGGMDRSRSTSLGSQQCWQLQSVDGVLCCLLSVIACRCALAASALGILNNSIRLILHTLAGVVVISFHICVFPSVFFFFSFFFVFNIIIIRLHVTIVADRVLKIKYYLSFFPLLKNKIYVLSFPPLLFVLFPPSSFVSAMEYK